MSDLELAADSAPKQEVPADSPPTLEPSAPNRVSESESAKHLLALFRTMWTIRRVEEESARAYAQGKIGGFLHLYIGQESVGVGALAALNPDDYVVCTYRDHGIAIAKGTEPKHVLAELFGKASGCSQGLGGSMHLFDVEHGMLGGYGIVGGHIPIAVGTAFASKYRGDGRVTLCFFGEGSVSIGAFHEALSLAALWHLPVVFICENNEYAMGTPLSRTMSVEDVSLKADAYGMRKGRMFAHDVREVQTIVAEAVDIARRLSEPTLLELRTYRFRGHSMSDPGKYRTKEELDSHKKQDPVMLAREALMTEHQFTENEILRLEAEVEREIEAAVAFAESAAEPTAAVLETTTYVGPFAS